MRNGIYGRNYSIYDVRWKKDVHFILSVNRWSGKYLYYVLRNGELLSCTNWAGKNAKKLLHSIQHLVNEIENGDFERKKTESEKIDEIIRNRKLTSCMNNTCTQNVLLVHFGTVILGFFYEKHLALAWV